MTLSGHLDATVLVDQVRIRVHERRPRSQGAYVRCRTGGADAVPRGFTVDLDNDPPSVWPVSPGGDPANAPLAVSVSKGEVEIFEVEARATRDIVEWTAELTVIVNGKRDLLRINDAGKPFVTAGTDGFSPLEWSGNKWQEAEPG